MQDAFLVIDKSPGLTSQRVVAKVKKLLGCRRIGHTGTLDPLATGVLPLALNRATRLIQFLDEAEKVYSGEIELGVESDTLDRDGEITAARPLPSSLDERRLVELMSGFLGRQTQTVPVYSAIKRGGRPLYDYARAGQAIEPPRREVEIKSFTLLSWQPPLLAFRVICSRGTYVRSLAAELGRQAGCGGRIWSLRRERSGPFSLDGALTLSQLEEMVPGARPLPWLGLRQSLAQLPGISAAELSTRIAHGVCPRLEDLPAAAALAPGTRFLLLDSEVRLLAVAERRAEGLTLLRVLSRT